MLTKPSFPVWLLCVAAGAFGVLVQIKVIPIAFLTAGALPVTFILVAAALALLVLACLLPML